MSNDIDLDDPAGTTLTIESVGNAQGGVVSELDDGTIVFTPDIGGDASFEYTVADGEGGTASALFQAEVRYETDIVQHVERFSFDDGAVLTVTTNQLNEGTLTGTDSIDDVINFAGNLGATFEGMGGDDILRGGTGDDTFDGGTGDDFIDGGGGKGRGASGTPEDAGGTFDRRLPRPLRCVDRGRCPWPGASGARAPASRASRATTSGWSAAKYAP